MKFRTKTLKIDKPILLRIKYFNSRIYKFNPTSDTKYLVSKIKQYCINPEVLRESKKYKLNTLNVILNNLEYLKFDDINRENDKVYAIEDIKKTIQYIEQLELKPTDDHEAILSKMYLIFNHANTIRILKSLKINLLKIKRFKYDIKSNRYIFNGHSIKFRHYSNGLLYHEDKYAYENIMRVALQNEFLKKSELGYHAWIYKLRNIYGYNTRWKYICNDKLLKIIYNL